MHPSFEEALLKSGRMDRTLRELTSEVYSAKRNLMKIQEMAAGEILKWAEVLAHTVGKQATTHRGEEGMVVSIEYHVGNR